MRPGDHEHGHRDAYSRDDAHDHEHAHGHAHGGAHAKPDTHASEQFPRVETAALVAEELAREQRRQLLQRVFVAFGITAIALGLPAHFEIGDNTPRIEATARGEWSALDLGSSILARLLNIVLPVTAAQAWFLLSALALGATAALCMSMGRRRGYSALTTILATVVVIAAPVAWIAGTTPGAAACGLFGAMWLFAALDANATNMSDGGTRTNEDTRRFATRATIAWLCAVLLHSWNVWLWPAYAFSLVRKRGSLATVALVAFVAWAGLVGGATAFEHGADHLENFLSHAWRAILAGGSGGPGPVIVWAVAWTYSLAGAAAGLVLVGRRVFGPPIARPPVWMIVFSLAPLVALGIGGVATFDAPYLWLAPIALVGTLEIARRSSLFAALALAANIAVVVVGALVRNSAR